MSASTAGGGGSAAAAGPAVALLERVRRGIIGDGEVMEGPFGPRRVTYADYTASGRSVDFIEDFIRDAVLPLYANTHTESSGTGLQTGRLREEARRIIRDAAGGTEDDLVIFCGSGATAAVNKLIGILELRIPAGLDERYQLAARIPAGQRPVVFVGPYEHHSNELPWRESIADVVVIGEDADGHIDLAGLRRQLTRFAQAGHRYLDDPVAREEGGTPGIVESIRAGLVFGLKQAIGTDLIQASEERHSRRALDRWAQNPGIEILGSHRSSRLPTGLSPQFEALRWFPLPPACLKPWPTGHGPGAAGHAPHGQASP